MGKWKILFSHRLSWSAPANRLAEEISILRQAGVALLDLSSSNPTTAQLEYPHNRIAESLGAIRNFTYVPAPLGIREARQAITNHYRERGYLVDSDRILVTASTSEAYSYLFKLLCDPGEEVLIPVPSYPLFEFLAALENVRCIPYHLRYDGSWHVDFHFLEQQISSRTKAIVVVNPNNPTGSFLKQAEVNRLIEIAVKNELAIISDEVFSDYPLRRMNETVETLVNAREGLIFSLNGLSKIAGMPQMKLGWMVASGDENKAKIVVEQLELILDTYLSVSTGVQYALPALLRIGDDVRAQLLTRIQQNHQFLQTALSDFPAHPLFTEGGWSTIIQLPRTQSEENWLYLLLHEKRVIAQPGYFFDMLSEAYLVISLITPPEIFREGIVRLKDLVQERTAF